MATGCLPNPSGGVFGPHFLAAKKLSHFNVPGLCVSSLCTSCQSRSVPGLLTVGHHSAHARRPNAFGHACGSTAQGEQLHVRKGKVAALSPTAPPWPARVPFCGNYQDRWYCRVLSLLLLSSADSPLNHFNTRMASLIRHPSSHFACLSAVGFLLKPGSCLGSLPESISIRTAMPKMERPFRRTTSTLTESPRETWAWQGAHCAWWGTESMTGGPCCWRALLQCQSSAPAQPHTLPCRQAAPTCQVSSVCGLQQYHCHM